MRRLAALLTALLLLMSGTTVAAESIDPAEYPAPQPRFFEEGSGFFDVIDDEPFFLHGENGLHYGFETDFWQGCSVWCAVTDYRVSAAASSFLAPQGQCSYDPQHIFSAERDHAWVEGADDDGVGEYIELTKRYSVCDEAYGVDFRELCVVNGYAQTAKKWTANGRVEKLKLYMNGTYVDTFCLADTMEPQYFDLTPYHLHAASGADSVFRFEIASVYPGALYSDTALTGIEIDFWTPNH